MENFIKIQQIIHSVMGVPVEEIQIDTHFWDELDADSLDYTGIVIEIEKAFSIQLPAETVEKIHRIRHWLEVIDEAKRS
ncbi:MAG: acyl carrier protein [Bacilli bacterium]